MSNNAAGRDAGASQPAKGASTSDASSEPSGSRTQTSSSNTDQRPDADSDAKASSAKEELRIYKTISRVHRACNACRKQKARCDGPENPPCRRCRQVGIECIFEKPPKDASSSGSGAPDASGSSDRIRALEAQMSGMQSMISELVASIKANTSAITAPPPQPPSHALSPHTSTASAASPHSSRSHRNDSYHAQRQHHTPLQQHPYAPPPHHRSSHHAISPSTEPLQRYPPDTGATGHPQRPPYAHSSRSFGSNSSIVGASSGSISSMPLQAAPGYPLQQPSFQTAYGHPPTKPEETLRHPPSEPEHFDPSARHSHMWNPGMSAPSAPQSTDAHARRRSVSRPSFDHDDRGRSSQPWQHANLLGSSSSPADAAAATTGASSGWTPTSAPGPPGPHANRRRWTSSDRAGSHSHSIEQNLTPSDGPAAGEDGDNRETDISNDQLSAPIEALRGLADAAAAAAAEESEGHTSNDSSDEKNVGETGRAKGAGEAGATPSLQLVDEGGKRTAFGSQDEDAVDLGGQSPRKKRRRHTSADSPGATAGLGAGPDAKSGAAGSHASAAASANTGANATSTLSPSAANSSGGSGRSGRMEAPGLVTSAPGDLVTLGLVNETDAMRLFETFQKGVPKFISIFHLEDESMSSEEAYHYVRTTSYFLFNVMLAIGAKVECGGKSPSRLYQTCMAQAKRNAKDTMFSPVAGKAAVQAMVLLAAYSENGWLPLGLSIRMAQELGLDRSFQKLMSALPASGYIRHPQPPPPPKHLTFYHNSPQASNYTGSPTDVNSVGGESADGKMGAAAANAAGANAVAAVAAANGNADAAAKRELDELKDLARGSRLWFFLFLFDHQASYGAGRPAMLSKHYVRNCRAFLTLNYPLTVKTDARFISTLELLIIRETHYDAMAPYDQPVDARMLSKMRKVTEELNEWHQYWSSDFESRGYAHDSFFQQSLVLQCASAELYLSCTALRGIRDANDADQMGPEQKELIIQATRAADTCLSISVNSKEYREMLGWAPHYTHVTAAFACVFLIKIARLFPRQVDTYGIFSNAERLASRLAEVPAVKYARVIRILLAQAWKKIADLSPAIGLYAALGAEATRPGAITPAEIKSGGPSDSGISLLYKLLQEYQNGQLEGDNPDGATAAGEASHNADGSTHNASGEPAGGFGARTPGFGDLANSSKWLMTGISSPSVGVAGVFGGVGVAGTGAMSPTKAGALSGLYSHRGSISGVDYTHAGGPTSGNANMDGVGWNSFLAPHTPSANHAGALGSDSANVHHSANQPIQLPLWMQESTGASSADLAFGDSLANEANTSASPSATRSWTTKDHYQSPLPHHNHAGSQYTSPSYTTPQPALAASHAHSGGLGSMVPPHHQHSHRHSNSIGGASGGGVAPSPGTNLQNTSTGAANVHGFTGTNFDSVLSDLGLPLDGLDGLFVDLPINAPTAQSNYSV